MWALGEDRESGDGRSTAFERGMNEDHEGYRRDHLREELLDKPHRRMIRPRRGTSRVHEERRLVGETRERGG